MEFSNQALYLKSGACAILLHALLLRVLHCVDPHAGGFGDQHLGFWNRTAAFPSERAPGEATTTTTSWTSCWSVVWRLCVAMGSWTCCPPCASSWTSSCLDRGRGGERGEADENIFFYIGFFIYVWTFCGVGGGTVYFHVSSASGRRRAGSRQGLGRLGRGGARTREQLSSGHSHAD